MQRTWVETRSNFSSLFFEALVYRIGCVFNCFAGCGGAKNSSSLSRRNYMFIVLDY